MKKFLMITCFFFGGLAVSQAQQTSPVWPGCEDAEDKAKCYNEKLSAHVREHYEYPMKDNEYIRGQVKVSFDINENGEVVVNSVEGPKPLVNEAARKMLEKIPDMKPGTLKGEPSSRNFTTTFKF
jgi:outer membrane biosynthesis protein TonB